MSVPTPRLTAGLVDRWFERVLDPPAEPGTRWPLSVDLTLSQQEGELLHSAAAVLRRVVDRPTDDAAASIGAAAGRLADRTAEPATQRVAAFLDAATAAISDTRRTLGLLAGGALDDGRSEGAGGSGTAGPGVDEDALAIAAGINAGAAALARDPGGPWRTAAPGEPTAAEAARRAGEAAAESAVGGADLSAVAGRAVSAMLAGWGPVGSGRAAPSEADARARAVIGRLLVGLQDATRPPDPPAAPAPCGAGPGDVLGRAFLAEITCQTTVPAGEVAALRAELTELAELVRVWPRAASAVGDGGGGWQRVHVHTDRPGAVIEALYSSGSVFDLQITTLD